MATKLEEGGDSSMGTQKSLRLPHRVEFPHCPLSNSGRLVRLFRSVILTLLCIMNSFRNQLPMRNAITA
jgi:hypothetical protein